jgi:hypothetical protein
MRVSSVRASSMRSRSEESITKTRPCVPIQYTSLAVVEGERRSGGKGTREIVAPQWSNLVLSTDIPHVELGVLVGDCFNVEADCWDGGNILFKLEIVEDS